MTEDLQRVQSYVAGLARRERSLLGARVAVNLFVLVVGVVVVLHLSAWLRLDRAATAGEVVEHEQVGR